VYTQRTPLEKEAFDEERKASPKWSSVPAKRDLKPTGEDGKNEVLRKRGKKEVVGCLRPVKKRDWVWQKKNLEKPPAEGNDTIRSNSDQEEEGWKKI